MKANEWLHLTFWVGSIFLLTTNSFLLVVLGLFMLGVALFWDYEGDYDDDLHSDELLEPYKVCPVSCRLGRRGLCTSRCLPDDPPPMPPNPPINMMK